MRRLVAVTVVVSGAVIACSPSGSVGAPRGFPAVGELPAQAGMPDPFLRVDGTRVGTRRDWEGQRRYLKAMLAHYQYGRMPPRPGRFETKRTLRREIFGGEAVEERYSVTIGREGRSVAFRMALIRSPSGGRRPAIVKNCHDFFDPDASLSGRPSKTAEYDLAAARMAVERGYILCKFIRTDLAPDRPNSRDEGVYPLYPEYDWGVIAVWAWGYQVVIDALDRLGYADMDRIVTTGHSRGGKAALCAGIYDERIAITAPNSSGTGGTGSMRYFEEGQRPQTIAHHKGRFDHWWGPRYLEFAGKESVLPFDAHFAKALIAPRGLVNAHARQDYWANPYGTELTARAAQIVFDWLGAGANQALHWREGGHAQNEEDWRALLDFADRYFYGKSGASRFDVLAYPKATLPISWKAPD